MVHLDYSVRRPDGWPKRIQNACAGLLAGFLTLSAEGATTKAGGWNSASTPFVPKLRLTAFGVVDETTSFSSDYTGVLIAPEPRAPRSLAAASYDLGYRSRTYGARPVGPASLGSRFGSAVGTGIFAIGMGLWAVGLATPFLGRSEEEGTALTAFILAPMVVGTGARLHGCSIDARPKIAPWIGWLTYWGGLIGSLTLGFAADNHDTASIQGKALIGSSVALFVASNAGSSLIFARNYFAAERSDTAVRCRWW